MSKPAQSADDAWCELVNTLNGMTEEELREWMDTAEQVAIHQEVMRLDDGKQNRKAALQVLRTFTLVDATKPLNPDLHDWLFHAFNRILNGDDPEAALQLKRQAGEKDTEELAPDPIAIALYVKLKQVQGGMTQAEARRAAQEHFARGERTIADACREVDLAPFDESDYPRLWAYIHAREEARRNKANRIKEAK